MSDNDNPYAASASQNQTSELSKNQTSEISKKQKKDKKEKKEKEGTSDLDKKKLKILKDEVSKLRTKNEQLDEQNKKLII